MKKYNIHENNEDNEKIINYLSNLTKQVLMLDYGYVSRKTGKKILIKNYKTQFKRFEKEYKYLSPDKVKKYKIAICFDVVNYLISIIKKDKYLKNIKNIKCIFCHNSKTYDSHIFLLIRYSGKYYFLTYDYKYVYSFISRLEYMKFIKKKYNYFIEYVDTNYGESYGDFMYSKLCMILNQKWI